MKFIFYFIFLAVSINATNLLGIDLLEATNKKIIYLEFSNIVDDYFFLDEDNNFKIILPNINISKECKNKSLLLGNYLNLINNNNFIELLIKKTEQEKVRIIPDKFFLVLEFTSKTQKNVWNYNLSDMGECKILPNKINLFSILDTNQLILSFRDLNFPKSVTCVTGKKQIDVLITGNITEIKEQTINMSTRLFKELKIKTIPSNTELGTVCMSFLLNKNSKSNFEFIGNALLVNVESSKTFLDWVLNKN